MYNMLNISSFCTSIFFYLISKRVLFLSNLKLTLLVIVILLNYFGLLRHARHVYHQRSLILFIFSAAKFWCCTHFTLSCWMKMCNSTGDFRLSNYIV